MNNQEDHGIAPKCQCGCGQDVTWHGLKHQWNNYIKGHHKRNYNPPPETRLKMSNSRIGYKYSQDAISKFKEAAQNRVQHQFERDGVYMGVCISDTEKFFLDELQNNTHYYIKRNPVVCHNPNKRVDGFIEEKNLIIEVDSRYHFTDQTQTTRQQWDIDRENKLRDMGYKFFRVSEKSVEENCQLCIDKFKTFMLTI